MKEKPEPPYPPKIMHEPISQKLVLRPAHPYREIGFLSSLTSYLIPRILSGRIGCHINPVFFGPQRSIGMEDEVFAADSMV
jgi:hypothetical protein